MGGLRHAHKCLGASTLVSSDLNHNVWAFSAHKFRIHPAYIYIDGSRIILARSLAQNVVLL